MKYIILALALFIGSQVGFAQTKIDHIEPAFWWAGMEHEELQILIHGENIAALKAQIDYPGVELKETILVENPNYLFLNLELKNDLKPGTAKLKLLRKGKLTFEYDYEFKAREIGSKLREGFSNKDIIYLITPDRFANGDESNDHIKGMYKDTDRSNPGMRHGGDIQGIIDHLDYIQEMGFSSIWICPLLESNQKEYSYHGYAITDYYKIDPRYGTNALYKEMVQKANEKGIKVIMDQVENHAGLYHWWSEDLPSADWYHHSEKVEKPYSSHKRTTLTDPHAPASEKAAFSDGWFVYRMPDLNQENELLATYLIQNSIWWIEYAGLQGIRQDTYPYPDPDFMAQWSKAIMTEYPNFNIVGEEWSYNPAIVARWQKGQTLQNEFDTYLPSLMDFPNQKAFVDALNKAPLDWGSVFDESYEVLANDFLYPDPSNLVTLMDNHDMARIFDQLGQDYDKFEMAMIYLYALRGIPQVYYGTEVLLSSPEHPDDHGKLRIDMPGGWMGDQVDVFESKGLSDDQLRAQNLIKKLNHIRVNSSAMQSGGLIHYSPSDDVYVLFRKDEQQTIMIVFNANSESVELDMARFYEITQGKTKLFDLLSENSQALDGSGLTLPARQAMILELD